MASNNNNSEVHGDTTGASSDAQEVGNQVLGQQPLAQLLLRILQSQEQTQERQTDILQQLVQAAKGNDAQGRAQGGLLREFLQLKPSIFSGSANPIDAEDWLNEMEKDFEAMHCPVQEKVTLATFKLQGGAFDWWDARKKKYPEGSLVTWELFKEEFYKKYFPATIQLKMELEFLQLKQDRKNVAEYEIEFSRLARYAQAYVQEDGIKACRFEQGLRQPIKARVEVFELKSFREVVNKALAVEQAYIEERIEIEHKRKKLRMDSLHQVDNQIEIHKDNNQNQRAPLLYKAIIKCVICQGNHWASQREHRKGRCFGCGKSGHVYGQCPNTKTQVVTPQLTKPLMQTHHSY